MAVRWYLHHSPPRLVLVMKDVFIRLRAIFEPYGETLIVTQDDEANLSIDTHHVMKNKKPLWFGGVNIKKNYVSFHLMPVYVTPALLENISPALRKRMQGKSCFNFKTVDDDLFAELSELTRQGYESYQAQGYVTA